MHALPTVIERGDVDAILDELCDPDRRLPVVVASTPLHTDFEDWLDQVVDPVTRGCTGLAVLYALSPAPSGLSTARWSTTASTAARSAPTCPAWTRPGPPRHPGTG
ncbi:hypothetical protein ACFQZC_17985 [Streptacidiphilus monticola]